MVRATRLAAPGDLVGDGALAGITLTLADYGRPTVTCHCSGAPWRLRQDPSTRQTDFFEILRVLTRDGGTRSRGPPPFFPAPPPGSKKIELRRVRVRGRSGPDNHLLCKETGVKCLVRAERSCERREFEDQVHVLAGKRVHVTTAGSPFAPT